MRSERYGWVVVAAAFTLLFLSFGAAYSFAAFFKDFQAEFNASRGHVALVFSVAAFIWFVSGAPGGMLSDRFGPRRVTAAGVVCLAGALWLAGRASSVEMLYVTYSIGIGIGIGLVYVPSVGAVQPWFTANRAFASGIAVAGIGAGNFFVPLFTAWWIERFGWRSAYLALATIVLVAGGAAALAIKALPRPKATVPEGVPLREALRTSEFALLYASLILSCVGLFVPMVHLGAFAQDVGYSEAQGVALVSFIGLGSLLGRFVVGPFADRLGRRLSLAACYAGLGVMLLVWWLAREYWILGLFALAYGTFYGASVALLPTIIMDLYGARSVSGIIGCLYTGAGVGTLLGPWLAGAAYDALGSYDVPILTGAAFSFLAGASILPLLSRGRAQVAHRS